MRKREQPLSCAPPSHARVAVCKPQLHPKTRKHLTPTEMQRQRQSPFNSTQIRPAGTAKYRLKFLTDACTFLFGEFRRRLLDHLKLARVSGVFCRHRASIDTVYN